MHVNGVETIDAGWKVIVAIAFGITAQGRNIERRVVEKVFELTREIGSLLAVRLA
jgi:hypothetical protein